MAVLHSHRYCDAACCLLGVLTTGAASLGGVELPLVVFLAMPPGGGGSREGSSAVAEVEVCGELC